MTANAEAPRNGTLDEKTRSLQPTDTAKKPRAWRGRRACVCRSCAECNGPVPVAH